MRGCFECNLIHFYRDRSSKSLTVQCKSAWLDRIAVVSIDRKAICEIVSALASVCVWKECIQAGARLLCTHCMTPCASMASACTAPNPSANESTALVVLITLSLSIVIPPCWSRHDGHFSIHSRRQRVPLGPVFVKDAGDAWARRFGRRTGGQAGRPILGLAWF